MRKTLLGLTLLAALAAGCGDGPEVRPITTTRRVEKAPRFTPPSVVDSAARFGYRRTPPAAPARPAYQWERPAGFTVTKGDDMRLASFGVEGSPDVDVSIIVLSGPAGGVVANVNRWRRQMGLGPAGEAEIGELPKLDVLGGPALFVALDGTWSGMGEEPRPGYRLLGVVARDGASTVFLKMTGPVDAVEDARPAFLDLASSLRRSAGVDPHAGHDHGPGEHEQVPPPDGGASGGAGIRWKVPEGWTTGGRGSMRLVTLHPAGREDAECSVVVLAGDGGGVAGNVNRWRGQMGRPPLAPAEIEALPRVTILGREGVLVDVEGTYTGMGETHDPGARMLGAIVLRPTDSVFVKLTGPAELVAAERERFLEFLRSLE